ncbi:MAG: HlyD family efflux transporter periplasmic adaptor subunit [Orrella sp.]
MSNMNPYDSDSAKPLVLGSRKDNYVAKAILLEEAAPPAYLRNTVRLALLSIAVFLVWSYFATLDVVALATGQIMPAQSVQIIQHVDGGRIATINVSDGEFVKRGQTLLTFNETEAKAEYETLDARYWGLYANIERLRALISDRPADFSKIPEKFAIVTQEQQATLLTGRDQLSQLTDQIRILSEVSSIRSSLAREQLATRVQALDAQRALSDAQADLLRYRSSHMDELNELTNELSQAEEQLLKLSDRLDRARVVSPVDGVVQGLEYKTVGGVIQPGATIMNVVPVGDKMHAEVKVSPTDIGFLKKGQEVRVKVGTFDFMRYGFINGQVSNISSFSTVAEEGEEPYFKVIVSLDKNHLTQDTDKKVEPGMTVQADIITDKQSVLRYLFRPIYVAFKQGMRER